MGRWRRSGVFVGALAGACGGGRGDGTDGATTAATSTATSAGVTESPTTGQPGTVEIGVALERREVDGPDMIVVDVTLTIDGGPGTEQTVTLTAEGGTAGAMTELGAGRYRGEVAPAQVSGEVLVRVEALGEEVERTAIVLSAVAAEWGQPERVRGSANTPGYEDSIELSHDGAWLIVSSYSPIDLLCCLLGCAGSAPADPAGAACNTALGPYAAPERPDMPGAARIVSPTQIHDELPSLGIDMPDGQDFVAALPPVAAYGFRRQPDGSYDEPFVIAFAADGSTAAPFGFSFVDVPQGTGAQVVFAWNDLRIADGTPEDTENDLWRETLTLGQANLLGTFTTPPMSLPQLDRELTRLPLVDHAGPQGNPAVTPDGVWWDAEGGSGDLYFAPGDVAGDALGTPVVVALSRPERGEFQPHVFADRLFFSSDHAEIRSAARAAGGDPAAPATWSEERVDLSSEPGSPRDGAVIAVGEPSPASVDGAPTLFFVYATRVGDGLQMAIGQVRARATP